MVCALLITGWSYVDSHNYHFLFDEMNDNPTIIRLLPESTAVPAQTDVAVIVSTTAPDDESVPSAISTEQTEVIPLIDLNKATVEELMQLKGIGQAKAEAIVAYRNKFDLFLRKEELNDVYGIGEKLYEQIKDYVYVGVTEIDIFNDEPAQTEHYEKVNINTADLETLMTLKGIGEAKAKAIIEYRETNGDFVMIEEIMDVSGIGEGIFDSISKYITVE